MKTMQTLSAFIRFLAAAAMAVGVSACVTTDDGRASKPLPAALVSQMSSNGMSQADPIFIRIFKKESELEVWKRRAGGEYALLKTYPMCRWSGQLGPKKREGDRQAPEGFYTVTPELMNPRSQFYLSFNLGYPNALESMKGYTGSALMVHGACTSSGCFAMTDDGVSEIYGLAREAFAGGQRNFQVQALPFRMTPENMAKHRASPHYAFWQNLKDGSDHFEAAKRPPAVAACGGKYVFNAQGAAMLDPASPCPSLTVDAEIAKLVSDRRTSDDAKFAELSRSISAGQFVHSDGGMHRSFRTLLQSVGVDRFQSMTSGKVEISRPDAALADPF